jgi:hypothetical protein
MTMQVDPLKISILALVVGLIALLFGPGILTRSWTSLQAYRHTRAAREPKVLEYLGHAVVFLDGLPLFIEETWAWGPGVPNYSAGGSFPDQNSAVAQGMPLVKAAVGEALDLYYTHSQKQGLPYDSKDEALRRLSEIQDRFWKSTKAFAKSEWPISWRARMRELRALKLPNSERDRILTLKTTRQ